MKKRTFKLLICVVFVFVVVPIKVFAHPGRLDSKGCHYCRTNCRSWGLETDEYHCHSGDTYTNSKGEVYNKSGTKISGSNSNDSNDSSKEETENNKTETKDETTNNNQQIEKLSTNSDSTNNKTPSKKPTTSTTKPTIAEQAEKSNDTSLKFVKINDKEITISEEMIYETNKKNVNISIEANNDKTIVDFNNSELLLGRNEIVIKTTAEAGNTKEYKLIINRIETTSEVTLKKFILNSSEVNFENNMASVSKLTNETSFKYEYELSDNKAILKMYLNDKEVNELNDIKDKDVLKLVIIDSDNNKNTYEIKINEFSKIESIIINIIAYTIIGIVMLSPVIVVGVIVYIKKRKKKIQR